MKEQKAYETTLNFRLFNNAFISMLSFIVHQTLLGWEKENNNWRLQLVVDQNGYRRILARFSVDLLISILWWFRK